jgi:hypothetical protein
MLRAVHFGAWHLMSEAEAVAPQTAGVLQTRAEGVMDYRIGRSAMVFYACSASDETLRGFVTGRGASQLARAVSAGARWIRFAESPHPKEELDRLLKGFVERFGSLPVGNAAGARKLQADHENGG